jgi:hypothetical protein
MRLLVTHLRVTSLRNPGFRDCSLTNRTAVNGLHGTLGIGSPVFLWRSNEQSGLQLDISILDVSVFPVRKRGCLLAEKLFHIRNRRPE